MGAVGTGAEPPSGLTRWFLTAAAAAAAALRGGLGGIEAHGRALRPTGGR